MLAWPAKDYVYYKSGVVVLAWPTVAVAAVLAVVVPVVAGAKPMSLMGNRMAIVAVRIVYSPDLAESVHCFRTLQTSRERKVSGFTRF